jgi:hypothetical protein
LAWQCPGATFFENPWGFTGDFLFNGGFHKWWYPQMDDLWKILLKMDDNWWYIGYFRTPPYGFGPENRGYKKGFFAHSGNMRR